MSVEIGTKTDFGRGDEKNDSVKFSTWWGSVGRVCEIHMKGVVTDMSSRFIRVIVEERSKG